MAKSISDNGKWKAEFEHGEYKQKHPSSATVKNSVREKSPNEGRKKPKTTCCPDWVSRRKVENCHRANPRFDER